MWDILSVLLRLSPCRFLADSGLSGEFHAFGGDSLGQFDGGFTVRVLRDKRAGEGVAEDGLLGVEGRFASSFALGLGDRGFLL